jgi:hypothetical protein
MNTWAARVYRLFDGLPWMLLFVYGYWVANDGWLAAVGFVGMSRRLLIGWEYPPPTVEELERRASKREVQREP